MTAPRRGPSGARGNRGSGDGRGSAGTGRSGAPRGGSGGGAERRPRPQGDRDRDVPPRESRGGSGGGFRSEGGDQGRGAAGSRGSGYPRGNREGADRGSSYSRDDRGSQGGRPAGERPQWQDRRPQGDRPSRPQGDRPQWQDRAPRGDRPQGDRPQWQDRRPQGDRPSRPQGDRPNWQDRGPRGDRPQGDRPQWQDRRPSRGSGDDRQDRRPPLPPGPELPEWVDASELDPAVRSALRGLDPRNAEKVAAHLVAAGSLVEDDPAAALAHARAARDRASRVAVVREAVGVAAYHAEDYAEAAREIRAYRRMSGDQGYRAVLADCERALGRPEVALRLVAEALSESPDSEESTELRLVEAGARRDLGEDAAARLVLEAALGGRPDPAALGASDPGRLRIASAYADLLADLGEQSRATEWLTAIAAADPEDVTGAVERLGIEFTELDEEEDDAADEDAVEDDLSPEEADLAAEPDAPGFAAEVEAEVAELLGETGDDDTEH